MNGANLNTDLDSTADRLRRLYSGEPTKVIYGVKTADAASWHLEQDERALARQWLAEPEWEWVYRPTPAPERGGSLRLTNRAGQCAATVFLFNDRGGHNWFVWNREGVGGENDRAPTVDDAIREAEAAVRRWGQYELPEPTTV